MRLLLRLIITAIALVAAVFVVPGITVEGNAYVAIGVTALVLGLVNAVVRPLLQVAACGLIVLTLGLILPFINGVTLWFASYIASEVLGVGFVVEGFWPAFWGALVVSAVSFVLSVLAPDEPERPASKVEIRRTDS